MLGVIARGHRSDSFVDFRFLRNWRARDDEADNIILQLEQPDYLNGQWPPRISFA